MAEVDPKVEDVEDGEEQVEDDAASRIGVKHGEIQADEEWLANYAASYLSTQSEAFFVLGVCLDSLDDRHPDSLHRTIGGIVLSMIPITYVSLSTIYTCFNVLRRNHIRPKLNGRRSMAIQKVSSTFFMAFSCFLVTGYERFAMRQFSSLLFLVIASFTDAVALADVYRDIDYYYNTLYNEDGTEFYDGKFTDRNIIEALKHAWKVAPDDSVACFFCFLDFALNVVVWVLIFAL